MPIVVTCGCGSILRAPDELAGKKAACPACMAVMQLPATPNAPSRISRRAGTGRFVCFVLLLALAPLAWGILHPTVEINVRTRIEQAIDAQPQARQKARGIALEQRTLDNMLDLLPGKRLNGALLPRDSRMHWAFALAVGGVFLFGIILLGFPRGDASILRLIGVAAFTGTIGVVLLMALQFIAAWTQDRILVARSVVILIFFYVLKFIGFAYRAAMDPASTGSMSYLGFTFGVGMCEELCKALPLLAHYRDRGETHLSWNGACAIGLVSGMAFGVAEGIMYAGEYYNGVERIDAYVIRFVSCVALHAVWTGAAAIFIYRQRDLIQHSETIWGVMGNSVALVSISMILHGVYDTLLKKDYHVAALGVAIASVAWLAWLIEAARRTYGVESDRGNEIAAM